MWREETMMSSKKKFIATALEEKITFSEVCRKFNISRECGYKWLKRYRQEGEKGLEEKSRKPHSFPVKTPDKTEEKILAVRHKHPAWGGRKIRAYLTIRGETSLPTPSTITRILHRHHEIKEEESEKHTPFIRFEHKEPNELWQMDFKGYFSTGSGICNPLTIIDDHSRYSLCVRACSNQKTGTVQDALVDTFQEYGLPKRMTMDNGPPWGNPRQAGAYTSLEVWLICLGIYIGHSRPFHPQTQGKDERFHRSLKEELLRGKTFKNLEEAQSHFDEWRQCYNHERPHEAIGMLPPASRYRISSRRYADSCLYVEYEKDARICQVALNGEITYEKNRYYISESMAKLPVKIVETDRYGIVAVYLKHQKIKEIDLINKVVAKKIL